jgi:mono/diheme cytochrome c family protein
MRLAATFIILVCVSFGAARAQDIGTEAQREAGKKVYEKMCAQCHGENGDGNGVAKPYFRPEPRDFTYGMFKIRTTPSGELPTTEDIKRVIRDGMPYTGMPAWPSLSEEEITNVTYYIKTFSQIFADPDFVVDPIDLPKAPKYSEESADLGKALYEENKCADCHGEHGRGNGKSAPTLKDEWGQPIRPADLTKRWTFRGGSTREDIYRRFSTGLNGTPMPSYADLIEPEDRWHLVDYVYRFSSRDEPEYSTVVAAAGMESEIDLSAGPSLFAEAEPAYFPVFGQIMEPGRDFYPSANGIEVRAVYDATDVALLLTWHDMTAETSGVNGPSLPVPMFGTGDEDPAGEYSDAVALQTPAQELPGAVKPYFLFGDAKNAVDLWFADLAKEQGGRFVGRGSTSLEATGDIVPVWSQWEDGEWNVVLKLPRFREEGRSFNEESFVPIAFSLWDGLGGERGNKRGVTSWYYLYLKPMHVESNAGPIAGYGVLTLLIELGVIGLVRWKHGTKSRKEEAVSDKGGPR